MRQVAHKLTFYYFLALCCGGPLLEFDCVVGASGLSKSVLELDDKSDATDDQFHLI